MYDHVLCAVYQTRRIFEVLPQLKYLDGIPKRPVDTGDKEPPPEQNTHDGYEHEDVYLANKERTPPSAHSECTIL